MSNPARTSSSKSSVPSRMMSTSMPWRISIPVILPRSGFDLLALARHILERQLAARPRALGVIGDRHVIRSRAVSPRAPSSRRCRARRSRSCACADRRGCAARARARAAHAPRRFRFRAPPTRSSGGMNGRFEAIVEVVLRTRSGTSRSWRSASRASNRCSLRACARSRSAATCSEDPVCHTIAAPGLLRRRQVQRERAALGAKSSRFVR